ncbi:MAG TPA: glutamate--tRNA ligase [Acidimicrobiales bacterium]|nr:glutamate--tRNA ligase [Acidimicrobiales bacterium]
MAPRLRFAPSPTGYFHVGGARTALYNWAFARQQGGTLILRIEDTDVERNKEEWVEGIYDAMRWVGLTWDELYRQSERMALYEAAAAQLEATGHAYWCDCTRGDIDARAKERGGPPGYDGHCRDRGLRAGDGRALRFRTPDDGVTVVHDIIRGDVEFPNATLDDPIIVRSNGTPIFVLANVVDDADMRITHVVRSEEHLPTTPKYILLWHALRAGGGAEGRPGELPVFAHCPVVVNEQRKKLSKRRDPVALELYRDEGYLPEVMVNYLALIGWSPPDGRERFTLEEMVRDFRLEDVGRSPGFFDVKKLRAFNGDAIRAMTVDDFVAAVEPFAVQLPWADQFDVDRFRTVAPLVQERVEVLSEAAPMVDFLFLDEPVVDEAAWAKAMGDEQAGAVLDAVATSWESIEWRADVIGEVTLAAGEPLGLSRKKAQAPVRVAITGRSVGPPLWESLELLGREPALARLRSARARL